MKNKYYCIKGLIPGVDNLYYWLRTSTNREQLRKFRTRQEAQEFIDKVLKPDNENVLYLIKEMEDECTPRYTFSYEGLYQLLDEATRFYTEYAGVKESTDEFIKGLINECESGYNNE